MTIRLQLMIICLCLTELILLSKVGFSRLWPLSVFIAYVGLIGLWERWREMDDREFLR